MTSDWKDQTSAPSCWQVPLLAVLNADRMAGEVRLLASGSARMEIQSFGLREVPARNGPGNVPVWRSFRYGHGPIALTLHGRVTATDQFNQAHADQVELGTYVEPGRLLNQFRFQIENWQQAVLPVRLPARAQLLSARVNGRWVEQTDAVESPERELIVGLPVPAGGAPHLFEVVYAIEGSGWRLWTRLSSPAPVLPLPAEGFRRTWHLPAGLAPVDEGQLQRLPGIGRTSSGQAAAAENARSAFSIISSFAEAPAGDEVAGSRNEVGIGRTGCEGARERQRYCD